MCLVKARQDSRATKLITTEWHKCDLLVRPTINLNFTTFETRQDCSVHARVIEI